MDRLLRVLGLALLLQGLFLAGLVLYSVQWGGWWAKVPEALVWCVAGGVTTWLGFGGSGARWRSRLLTGSFGAIVLLGVVHGLLLSLTGTAVVLLVQERATPAPVEVGLSDGAFRPVTARSGLHVALLTNGQFQGVQIRCAGQATSARNLAYLSAGMTLVAARLDGCVVRSSNRYNAI